MDSLLVFTTFDKKVDCAESEYATFNPPSGETCSSYLADFMAPKGDGSRTYLRNPDASESGQVCKYRYGSDYLASLNINDYYYGWRDVGIVVIFVIAGYGAVYGLMKLRTKASKKAEE